jgi:tetratricopeptide (TPR) repeat protein
MMGSRTIALACVLWATRAAAEVSPADAAKAKALFDQGQAEMDAGKIDAACATFEASFRLDPQIGARLNLGDCREREGKLVEAYALFSAAANEARRTQKQGREAFARQRMAALQAKLVRVSVRVAQPAPGLTVKLGERALLPAEWTVEQVVRPGQIVVDASAPDRRPFHVEESAMAGAAIEIVVPVLPPVAEAAAPEPPAPTRHVDRTTWILGGSGAGILIASVAIGLHAKSRYDTAAKAGDRNGVSSAQTEADVATVFAVAGAAVITVGIVRYLRTRSDPDRVSIAPALGPGTIGIVVAGSL